MHKRIQALYIKIDGLLGAGLLYVFTCILAGRPLIPCLFHTVTGLYCPGCDVSQMRLSLLRLDFTPAFQASAATFPLLPPGLFMTVWTAIRYIGIESTRLTWVQACVFYIMTGMLLVFRVLRSLPRFGWLQP